MKNIVVLTRPADYRKESEQIHRAYQRGREDATKKLEAVRRWLEDKNTYR